MNKAERIPVVFLVSLLLASVSILTSCQVFVTPAHSVDVQNNFGKSLVIYSRTFMEGEWGETQNWGQVDPGAKKAVFSMVEPTSKSADKKYLVEARDIDGKVIRTWEFPYQDRVLLVIDNADVPK